MRPYRFSKSKWSDMRDTVGAVLEEKFVMSFPPSHLLTIGEPR